jgi:CHAD domain-containing protein
MNRGDTSLPSVAQTPVQAEHLEAWNVVRDLALKQLNRFASLEPKVLKGDDPDAIHDMRVASRRLQQILDLAHPKPRPREVRRLRRSIQRCRRALGDVRNCDVLLGRVKIFLKRKRSARREAWTAVQHYLQARRSESLQKGLRKLSKVNLAIFYVNMKECLAQVGSAPVPDRHPHTQAPAELPSPEQFPERLAQVLEDAWNRFEEQIDLSHHDPRGPVIHGARITAKRLRYLLEVVHDFDVPGSAEALAWLRQLQQHLGDWHDLEVLEQMMIEMIARPDFLREHVPLVMQLEKLVLRNRDLKQEFQEHYFQMTGDSAELQRLKNWVGYLLESPSAAFARA